MNFQSVRQISDGVAVATSRKSNVTDGNSGKIDIALFDEVLVLYGWFPSIMMLIVSAILQKIHCILLSFPLLQRSQLMWF